MRYHAQSPSTVTPKPPVLNQAKSWLGLLLPTGGRWASRRLQEKADVMRMEFKSFCHYFVHLPCRIIQAGRRVVYRILGWNPYLPVLLRAFERFRRPLRC